MVPDIVVMMDGLGLDQQQWPGGANLCRQLVDAPDAMVAWTVPARSFPRTGNVSSSSAGSQLSWWADTPGVTAIIGAHQV
jgi:hypothetical protein